jgi:hypothetical protein
MATLGGFFGLLALIMACRGMFGAIAFQVSRRINKLGVRMALGANRGRIVALVLREVAAMLLAGSALGRSSIAGPDRPGAKDAIRNHTDAVRRVRLVGSSACCGRSRRGMVACAARIARRSHGGAASRVGSYVLRPTAPSRSRLC